MMWASLYVLLGLALIAVVGDEKARQWLAIFALVLLSVALWPLTLGLVFILRARARRRNKALAAQAREAELARRIRRAEEIIRKIEAERLEKGGAK